MEKLNFIRNGVMRLPPGFRFHPTDEELVVQYLKRKVYSCPLPASIIPEVDVCKHDPWDLPGDWEQERYFFSIREAKYPNGNRSNRATGSGYWKATGSDKPIVSSKGKQVVGMKKVLVFYAGKPPKGTRTDWIMHEYRLADAESRACIFPERKNSTQNSMPQMDDWVVRRLFLKKTSAKNDVKITQLCKKRVTTGFIDFMMQQRTDLDSSSSSNLSGVTELSSTGSHNEETSSCNSFSSSFCGREA
ncbi:NAC domain-containing protein 83-like isoform X2 [Tasmannia lanceolata]|uniref:NAC domain-containing protein 83-like isoform X2 n=1 Tax=Tasmannia lanceolata TaxID=3420 RepID=UPI004062AAFA